MQGKSVFSKSEIAGIKNLLRKMEFADSQTKKNIRGQLRKMDFYISEYSNSKGFTLTHFEQLLKESAIKISEDPFLKTASKELKGFKKTSVEQKSITVFKDEHYVIDLCDKVLNLIAKRQGRFDFLIGDPDKNGRCVKLPVDAYYFELNLVIEYCERQHSEETKFFDKPDKITNSGVHRGEQRKIYDQRRHRVLPMHGISILEISYSDFNYDSNKRIIRNFMNDEKILKRKLKAFLDKLNNSRGKTPT